MLEIKHKSTEPCILLTDDNEIKDLKPKLMKVLKKILQPDVKLHNDDYLNLLLTHLTKPTDKFLTQEQEDMKQFLVEWIKEAVTHFEGCTNVQNPTILTFFLNVTRYISASEHLFVILNSDDIFERLLTIIRRISQPNLSVSLIKLHSDVLEHKSGIQWIVSTNYWKHVLDIILNNETVYVSKEGYKFVTKLLEKSISLNPTFCKNLVQHILTPINETTKILSEGVTDKINSKFLLSTVKLIINVLTILLPESGQSNRKAVIRIFIENHDLEKRVNTLVRHICKPELTDDLYKLLICLSFYELKSNFSGQNTLNVEKAHQCTTLIAILYDATTKLSVISMLQLLYKTLDLYATIKGSMPKCVSSDQKEIRFEDQIMCIQLVPLVTNFVKVIGIEICCSEDQTDDFRSQFISKFMDNIYSKTIRIEYKWMRSLSDNFSVNNGILSLKFFIHCIQFYNRDNGVFAFQLLNYLLADLNSVLKSKPLVFMEFSNNQDYLALHLNVMAMLIEEFDLTWRDVVEALCIINLVHNLLNGFVWPSKIVVNALKLAEKGISKYMNFNMALLIDETEESVMNEFIPLLSIKLHDGAWEVRDSTLELIHQLSKTTNKAKFTSYNKLFLENNFPIAIVRLATSDGSAFVRASALKGLQEMVKIQEFWNNITSSCSIFEQILQILRVETEGVVRAEAALIVDCIYEHQHIPDEIISTIYDAMSHAVIADLHWEVRINALKFWKRVIDDRLHQQGMIDGCFPSVTFSKQHKKIVTLNSDEIRKRLVTVLLELSGIGCLAVFYEALQDECDLEVSKFATKTIANFVSLLKEYDVSLEWLQVLSSTTSLITETPDVLDIPKVTQNLMDIESSNLSLHRPYSDTVMDEILDTRDLNLLESVFNTTDTPVMENIEVKKCIALNPQEFLNLIYSDLESRVNEKSKIIEGIDNIQSLLDDILKEYEPTEVNAMDCY